MIFVFEFLEVNRATVSPRWPASANNEPAYAANARYGRVKSKERTKESHTRRPVFQLPASVKPPPIMASRISRATWDSCRRHSHHSFRKRHRRRWTEDVIEGPTYSPPLYFGLIKIGAAPVSIAAPDLLRAPTTQRRPVRVISASERAWRLFVAITGLITWQCERGSRLYPAH